MVTFGDREKSKEKFRASKRSIKIWDVNVDNFIISKLVKTETNSKYLIGYLDKARRPLVLIIPEIIGYVETFKVKEGYNKLMSFRVDDEKVLKKYKALLTKIEDYYY